MTFEQTTRARLALPVLKSGAAGAGTDLDARASSAQISPS